MRIAIAILGAALASGCKDKPKTQPAQPTATADGSGAGAAGAAGPAGSDGSDGSDGADGSGAGSGHPRWRNPVPKNAPITPKQNVLDLPKASRAKPVKTTKPLAKPELERISQLEYPGWKRDVRHLSDKALEIRYRTDERPILGVTIMASRCFDCLPLELPKWKAKEAGLKTLLSPELRDRADTTFEVGETNLNGAPLIYTYQVGYLFGPDESGQSQGAYSHAYALYYNDAVNQIRVITQYMDDPAASRADMVNLAPREDLEMIGKAFFDAYTQAWAPAAK